VYKLVYLQLPQPGACKLWSCFEVCQSNLGDVLGSSYLHLLGRRVLSDDDQPCVYSSVFQHDDVAHCQVRSQAQEPVGIIND
jgi:hypothetical protein